MTQSAVTATSTTSGRERTTDGLWTHRGVLALRGGYLEVPEIVRPTTPPPAGWVRLYAKADHKLYLLDAANVEHVVTSTP